MTIATPIWLQAGSYSAKRDRQALASMWDEGVLKPRSFKPTQTSSPTYAIAVAVGRAVIQGDDEPDQGSYIVTSDAVETVTWPAPPASNQRIDVLVLRVNDPNAGGPAGSNAQLVVVSGTAGTSPTAPSVPNTAMPIAQVTTVAGQTTISNAQIIDLRIPAGKVEEVGTLKAYSGGLVPSNWILADGVARLRADWPELNELYASLGYPYGTGNGSTTFGIPDGRGRAVMGAGVGFPIGTLGGAAGVTLTMANLPSHNHTGTSHNHSGPDHAHTGPYHDHAGPWHGHDFNVNTGGGGYHDHSGYVPGTWIAGGTANPSGTMANPSYGGAEARANPGIYANPNGDHAHNVAGGTAGAGNGATGGGGNGWTGGGGGGATGMSGTGVTGSTGGPGGAISTIGPHVVVGGLLIRAA